MTFEAVLEYNGVTGDALHRQEGTLKNCKPTLIVVVKQIIISAVKNRTKELLAEKEAILAELFAMNFYQPDQAQLFAA